MESTCRPVFYTVKELASRGPQDIPEEFIFSKHLIYSSPATLAFNSPGAEGYGVKRAGLAVPGSVMLIVSPGCCGRNTSAIGRMPGYEDRFFYLTMDETDLVTGRHLQKIPRAVRAVCRELAKRGKEARVVMICITCVDALLGTDMDRVCRKAEEAAPGVRVRPCYMYALTREGRKPPMVHVRQSLYGLLEPRKKRASSVNLLGFFAPLAADAGAGLAGAGDSFSGDGAAAVPTDAASAVPGSELISLLRQAGVRTVRQIGACADYDEFQKMAEANFNLVLHPEARPAAYDMEKRLGIPFIELRRFYQIDRIRAQYAALGRVLQTSFDDAKWEKEASEAVACFRARFPDAVFSIGEAMNGNPFELACALAREGFAVREIFGTVAEDSFIWIRILSEISPGTRVYSNLHPSMLHYGEENALGGTSAPAGMGHSVFGGMSGGEKTGEGISITVGRDAGWYHPDLPNVQWNTDVQPYGYRAVTGLFRALEAAMEAGTRGSFASAVTLGEREEGGDATSPYAHPQEQEDGQAHADAWPDSPQEALPLPRGLRLHTTPFAPDQSGAVSVLYDMDGICVICDAGGCTGNICGFDEPRWFHRPSPVFSAGLRDMDAILGRDDRLVEKLAEAARQVPASFAAIVGTPVPAVIGTDHRALCRLAQKKTGLPTLGIDTDGMAYYDKGIEKAYLALLETLLAARGTQDTGRNHDQARILGVWGYSPLDFQGILTKGQLREWALRQGYSEIFCVGADARAQDFGKLACVEKNIALSPAGAAAARWLQRRYSTQWEYRIPCVEDILQAAMPAPAVGIEGKKILIIHQQVLANAFRSLLVRTGAQVDVAGFFTMDGDAMEAGDVRLREETDFRALVAKGHYDCIVGDRSLRPILGEDSPLWIHLPHFAVSGEQWGARIP